MTEIIGVKFKGNGKIYYFDPCGIKADIGDRVVVETSRGIELGDVALSNREVEDSEIMQPLKKTLRLATPEDIAAAEANRAREKEAFDICLSCIEKHKLEMNLVEAEYAFDGSKLLFYFTADGRVDFRELVKDLASIFRTRIELRQIGVRDEAKMLGGIGICGRPFCCSTFLEEFHPVSIKMAKEQSLSLNPSKISGACGRLMCCLKYEQAAYEDLYRRTPVLDSIVETPDGRGTVVDIMLLKGLVKVRLDKNPEAPPSVYTVDACKVIVPGRGKKEKPPIFEGDEE
jgi:cell fate regulator YaaT (PSP1 superfamily)